MQALLGVRDSLFTLTDHFSILSSRALTHLLECYVCTLAPPLSGARGDFHPSLQSRCLLCGCFRCWVFHLDLSCRQSQAGRRKLNTSFCGTVDDEERVAYTYIRAGCGVVSNGEYHMQRKKRGILVGTFAGPKPLHCSHYSRLRARPVALS